MFEKFTEGAIKVNTIIFIYQHST